MKFSNVTLAKLSQAAYSDPPTFEAAGTQCVRTTIDGNVVYAFRGTEFDYKDILRDIRTVPWWDSKIGWCHRGFLMGVRAVWDDLFTSVQRDIDAGLNVWFTGHSLGGALAQIAAALCIANGCIPEGVEVFGSPRPGFAKLHKILARTTKCYRRGKDIVPTVPHRLFGFRNLPWIGLGRPRNGFLDHQIAGYVEDIS